MSATTPRSTDEPTSTDADSDTESSAAESSAGESSAGESSAGESSAADPSSKEERLAAYLRERASGGDMYFKSKVIADDVDLSSKEIGALIVKLQDSLEDLSIERWSYTGATTWRVEHTA